MRLLNFKPHFDNAYQEIFMKVLVGKSIANLRFEKMLKLGESVERVAYNIDNVRVRPVVRGAASTIDIITDTPELLTINLEYESVFHISDGEVTQAGPLNPGEVIGGKIAHKVATDLDARILTETLNAGSTFDTGDLTALTSNGTAIVMNVTTVPQMVSRMPAKLRSRNQVLTNLAWVLDSYAASDIEQFLMSRNIDIAGAVFKNGYAGETRNAVLYVSENLTGEATLTSTGVFTNTQNVSINGIVFTTVTALSTGPAVPGEVLIGANAEATLTNLRNALNAPSVTTATYTAVSPVHQALLDELKITATSTATALNIRAVGSGRLVLAETQTNASWTRNFLHSYYGKKGAIDVVVQDLSPVDMRPTDNRRGTNVFSSYLAGIRTFADGRLKFLDVHIAV